VKEVLKALFTDPIGLLWMLFCLSLITTGVLLLFLINL